jgi:dihydroorotate dehydrogenase (fumarate)
MDLSTTYLGLPLSSPLMPGASPMADQLDWVRRLEDAGASAIVLRSLFEEQITQEQQGLIHHMEIHDNGFAEALSYFPKPDEFAFGPTQYLEQIRQVKAAVQVPVIASLNGVSAAGWLDYAKQIQQAGADALELNVYFIATNPSERGDIVERRVIEIARVVAGAVTIPVAVKLSPFFSSISNLAHQLDVIEIGRASCRERV